MAIVLWDLSIIVKFLLYGHNVIYQSPTADPNNVFYKAFSVPQEALLPEK